MHNIYDLRWCVFAWRKQNIPVLASPGRKGLRLSFSTLHLPVSPILHPDDENMDAG